MTNEHEMSSSQKRPAARRRPTVGPPASGRPGDPGPPGSAPNPDTSTNPTPPKPSVSGKGLLGSIIGGIKREGAHKKAALADGVSVTAADVETREDRLARARRDFEGKHRKSMVDMLVDGTEDLTMFIEFEPMQKQWRNILHELAGELFLHAESIELEDPAATGDKYVVVYKKPPVLELTEAAEARRLMNAAANRQKGVKKGAALTDQAPVFATGVANAELTTVGTVKRDLRGVAQTFDEMKERKRKRDEVQGGNKG